MGLGVRNSTGYARTSIPEAMELARAAKSRGMLRRVLWRVQGGVCGICGYDMPRIGCHESREDRPTSDHVVPVARKGPDRLGNIVCAHMRCNEIKSDRMPTGCELIFLLAVNARLGVQPQGW